MAYMKELNIKCNCGKQAVVEVFNTRNGSMGKFCREHGKRKLRETQRYEDEKAVLARAYIEQRGNPVLDKPVSEDN